MSVLISGVSSSSPPLGMPTSTNRVAKSVEAQSPEQQLLEYANMTPAQQLFASMLGKLGITEDQFKAMSPAEQQKTEDKIRDMIKKQLDNSAQKPAGMITDKSVSQRHLVPASSRCLWRSAGNRQSHDKLDDERQRDGCVAQLKQQQVVAVAACESPGEATGGRMLTRQCRRGFFCSTGR
jgi:hypothetical protein